MRKEEEKEMCSAKTEAKNKKEKETLLATGERGFKRRFLGQDHELSELHECNLFSVIPVKAELYFITKSYADMFPKIATEFTKLNGRGTRNHSSVKQAPGPAGSPGNV